MQESKTVLQILDRVAALGVGTLYFSNSRFQLLPYRIKAQQVFAISARQQSRIDGATDTRFRQSVQWFIVDNPTVDIG
jgi:hypothetical protein